MKEDSVYVRGVRVPMGHEMINEVLHIKDPKCSTPFRSDLIGGSEPDLGCLFNSFYLLLFWLFFFLVKVSQPESWTQLKGRI